MRTNYRDSLTKLKIMATRIRLQRHGKKGKPIYHIVIADQRAPDGRYIEKLGLYNPSIQQLLI